ncbi:hypothetical protein BCV72DRAFT_225375 [Rhizopus microsporus var. microsporus]|uniref:Transmembrane protein n=2 Tax=Rhizopus microsporus TaxID=58291 RepID=A0A2G4SLV6_RHIZD|nr:uncharacterized protein RHIMIDRAFT_262371 [Rhizopus microsporus ATCC 52813]ORE08256.1 hypothetical protein BCV72DRAFT_225375 [Rhizopus microsporus var. microsporus]PHZ09750.1 hypothetical protein RHIMIDRAFT_262371 [Rhizopus microsporus ATCC 52813]
MKEKRNEKGPHIYTISVSCGSLLLVEMIMIFLKVVNSLWGVNNDDANPCLLLLSY